MGRMQFLKKKLKEEDESVWDQPVGLPVNFGARRYDPGRGTDEGGGQIGHSGLTDNCSGDWSWKPLRDKLLGDGFKTFRGVPPSPAELAHKARSNK